MTTDLDVLSITPDALDQQDAEDNRFGGRPKVVEGNWDGKTVPAQDVNRQTGEVYPRVGFVLTDCKFEAGPQDAGKWTDGESYTVTVRPPEPGDKKLYQKEFGMMVRESGHPLEFFAGSRVRLTELGKKPWPTANKPTYFYKWEKVGAGATSNGHTPEAEMSEDTVSRALAYIAEGQYTEAGASTMLVKTMGPQLEQAGLPPGTAAAWTGKFATGEFVKEALASGKLAKDGETLVVA